MEIIKNDTVHDTVTVFSKEPFTVEEAKEYLNSELPLSVAVDKVISTSSNTMTFNLKTY